MEVPGHDLQTLEQALGVKQVFHPQGVDDDLYVIVSFVPSEVSFVLLEELHQQTPDLVIWRVVTVLTGDC